MQHARLVVGIKEVVITGAATLAVDADHRRLAVRRVQTLGLTHADRRNGRNAEGIPARKRRRVARHQSAVRVALALVVDALGVAEAKVFIGIAVLAQELSCPWQIVK